MMSALPGSFRKAGWVGGVGMGAVYSMESLIPYGNSLL